MKKVNESGAQKNIIAFERLIAIVKTFGPAYNPSKLSMQITGLDQSLIDVRELAEGKRDAKTLFDNSTNSRVVVFRNATTFSTQIINALKAYGAAAETVSDARGFVNKMTGRSSSQKDLSAVAEEAVVTPEDPTVKQLKTISSYQTSYDNKLEHFARLINVAKNEPSYQPNEENLKPLGLDAKHDELQASNTQVINHYSEWSRFRILLHEKIQNPLTGIIANANAVKQYTKAVFGASSNEHRQLSAIQFTYSKL